MSNSPLRRTLWIGLVVYAVLAILSLVFYLERTVFIDLAFHTVSILKNKSLFIQNQRFVAALTQVFPLTAQALHFSLKGVLMAYSAGFILYYGAVFFVITAWLRQWQMGLVLLLCSTLLVTHTFYWIQSELPQGMALLALTFAVLLRYREKIRGWQLGLLFALWVSVVYAHPMLAFPTFFLLFFFWEKDASKALIRRKWIVGSGVFVLLLMLLKTKVLGPSSYDAEAMSRVKNLVRLFPHYFDLASNRDFLRWCLNHYNLLVAAFFVNAGYYIWQKSWYKLLLFSGFFIGYLLLVNVSIPNGFHRFYMENLYLPLALFTAVPLIFDVLPHFKGDKTGFPDWAFIVLVAGLAIRVADIGLSHRFWTERLDWERNFIKETAGLPRPKLLVAEKLVPMDKLVMAWGSSFEFLLLSSLENPDSTRLIAIYEDPSREAWATDKRRSVITKWGVWDFDKLPHRYFNPQDTSLYEIRN